MDLIEEASGIGCRRPAACAELDTSLRTYQRWTRGDGAGQDGRKSAQRPAPVNKLSEAERAAILVVVNSLEFASQPPSQIVPTLVDRGEYLASESTIYRVMKEAAQQHHRGHAKKPSTRVVTRHCSTEPNRLWSWDITWLPTAVKGLYCWRRFSKSAPTLVIYNEEFQCNASTGLHLGAPILCTKNLWDWGLQNGSLGTLEEIERQPRL